MKRCIETHEVAAFGTIPEGSLWDDDSPYLEHLDKFETLTVPVPEPVKRPPVRKFGAKPKDGG